MVSLEDIKLPPNDINAEKSFLSCIFLNNAYMSETKLNESDFYRNEHRLLFACMKSLFKEGLVIDITTVSSCKVDIDYIIDIATDVIGTSGFLSYESIIKNKSVYRDTIQTAQNIVYKCFEEADLGSIIQYSKKLTDCFTKNEEQGITWLDAALNFIDNVGKEQQSLASYGFRDLDEIVGGLKKGQLIVVGGATSAGKTLVTLNIIEKIIQQGLRVGLFSLEMDDQETVGRFIAKWAKTQTKDLADINNLSKIQEATASNIQDEMGLYIFWKNSSLSFITNNIRRLHIQHNTQVFVVDHLGLVAPIPGHKMTRNDHVGYITRELKMLAQELGIVVILLSQINRESSKTGDEPNLHHLRDSGNIEQDANVVLLVHREKDSPIYRDKIKILVAKNRNGKRGDIYLGLNPGYMSIYDIEQPDESF